MGFEILRSLVLKRLIFVVYVLSIFVIAANAPAQREVLSEVSPAALDPTIARQTIAEPAIARQTIAEPTIARTDIMDPDPGSLILKATNTASIAPVTPVPQPARVIPPTPAPAAPSRISLPADLRPLGSHFEYKDNNRKQIVSVSVKNFFVVPQYSYLFEDLASPDVVHVYARPGYKFLLVGITWDLTRVVGEGTRTSFMTPTTASYKLVHEGYVYQALPPSTFENALNDYIINQGCLARDKLIDKDNPGSGILIFEVPEQFHVGDAYLEFCPRNALSLKDQPRSPDNWDCATMSVRWKFTA
jgi:hypothetical protein